jgi:hypothetical protein
VTITDLLVYPAFRGLGYVAAAACFVLVGVMGMFIISHLMFSFGQRSSLYKQRKPVPGWSKRFYPAASAMLLFLLVLGLWLRSQLSQITP